MILVVEDNMELRRVLQALVARLGYECKAVGTGEEAASCCVACSVDLILMDIALPQMNGLEATKQIREFERQSGRAAVPIIAFTAGAAEKRDCLNAGMDDFLMKPILLADLKELLIRWHVPRCGH